MTINERIQALIDAKKMTQSSLASDLKLTRVTVNQWCKIGGSVGIDTVVKLLTRFSDLNARWLILGTGEMFDKTPIDYDLKKEVSKMVAEEMEKYHNSNDKKDIGKCG